MSLVATTSALVRAPRASPARVSASRDASPSARPSAAPAANRRGCARLKMRWGASATGRRAARPFLLRAVADSADEPTEGGIPLRNLRRDMSAQEYAELKASLFKNTSLYAVGLVAYSTLGYGVANGISAAVGGGASLVYLKLLCDYVDGLNADDTADPDGSMYTRNLVYEPVTDVFGMLGGAFGKVGAVYSQALLQKRLLVPVLVAASCSAFNAAEMPFDVNYGPVLLGFLTYKAAVLTKLYEDIKPDIVSAIAGGPGEEDEK